MVMSKQNIVQQNGFKCTSDFGHYCKGVDLDIDSLGRTFPALHCVCKKLCTHYKVSRRTVVKCGMNVKGRLQLYRDKLQSFIYHITGTCNEFKNGMYCSHPKEEKATKMLCTKKNTKELKVLQAFLVNLMNDVDALIYDTGTTHVESFFNRARVNCPKGINFTTMMAPLLQLGVLEQNEGTGMTIKATVLQEVGFDVTVKEFTQYKSTYKSETLSKKGSTLKNTNRRN